MGEPWFVERPDALVELRSLVKTKLRGLHVVQDDSVVRLRGAFRVLGADDQVVDFFRVDVEISSDHPRSPPKVEETGGRIPRHIDRHVFESGFACLGVPEEILEYWKKTLSIVDFMRGPVNQYFLGQIHFELTGRFPFGERPHGAVGLLEYYVEKLGISDVLQVVVALKIAISKEVLAGGTCFCSSHAALQECHLWQLLKLRQYVPRTQLLSSLKSISKWLGAKRVADAPAKGMVGTMSYFLLSAPWAKSVQQTLKKPKPRKAPRRKLASVSTFWL